jgi:peptidoglycan/LPS O-acetylase OafA/YrhL
VEKKTGRLKVLDGLRALAILLVLSEHVARLLYRGPSHPLTIFGSEHVAWFFQNGWVGVDLFFILSGFLITSQLTDPRLKVSEWRGVLLWRYFRRRLFRIVPAYYLVLAVSVVATLQTEGPITSENVKNWLWRIFYHLVFMQDYFPPNFWPVFWSLATEAKFYLIAPFIVMALTRLKPTECYLWLACIMVGLLVIKLMTALSMPFVVDESVFFLYFRVKFHMALDSLMAGMAVCFMWQDARVRAFLERPLLANSMFATGLALFLALTAGVMPYYQQQPPISLFSETGFFSLIALAFAAMMLGLLAGCFVSGIFEHRALRGVATISYSLYLTHTLFVPLALFVALKWFPLTDDVTWLWGAGLCLLLLITLPVSTWLYYLVERPFIQWAHQPSKAERRLLWAYRSNP